MIEIFMSWLEDNKYQFYEHGFSDFDITHISPKKGGVGSVIITIENGRYICQFSITNDGLNNIEVLSTETEEMVLLIYSQITNKVNYENFMRVFFDFFNQNSIKTGEKMTAKFLKCLKKSKHKFNILGFHDVTTRNITDENRKISFVYASMENNRYICNFTIGNDGCNNIEIEAKEKGTMPFWIHSKLTNTVNYDNFMSIFFDFFD